MGIKWQQNWKLCISRCWSILTAVMLRIGESSGPPLAGDRLVPFICIASHTSRCVERNWWGGGADIAVVPSIIYRPTQGPKKIKNLHIIWETEIAFLFLSSCYQKQAFPIFLCTPPRRRIKMQYRIIIGQPVKSLGKDYVWCLQLAQ